MKNTDLIINEDSGILRITLNRPQVRNAMNTSMVEEITAQIENFDKSPYLRVAVLSGAGQSFSSGSDINEWRGNQEQREKHMRSLVSMYKAFHDCSKFIIAEARGNVLGGGMALAMICDCIIASESARFGLPEIKYGFLPAIAVAPIVFRNPEKALEIMITGEILDSNQALSMNLISKVYSDEQLSSKVTELAVLIASRKPEATGEAKHLCRTLLSMNYEKALEYAYEFIMSGIHEAESK